MTCSWRWTWGAGVAGAVLAMALTVSAQTSTPPKDAAATVGDEVISMTDLEKSSAIELASLDEQRYRLLDRKLGQIIAERLLAREAKRRGVSLEALVQAEVTSKTPPVTGEDVNAFITQNRARLPQGDEADLKGKVADYLHRLQVSQRTEAFVNLRPFFTMTSPSPSLMSRLAFCHGIRSRTTSLRTRSFFLSKVMTSDW